MLYNCELQCVIQTLIIVLTILVKQLFDSYLRGVEH